jgi:hypothetical protein
MQNSRRSNIQLALDVALDTRSQQADNQNILLAPLPQESVEQAPIWFRTVSFTGTRSIQQEQGDLETICEVVSALPFTSRIVTGGCTGVDTIVASYAHAAGYHVHTVLPTNLSQVDPDWQKHCSTFEQASGHYPVSYRTRNQRLVRLADELIVIAAYPETSNMSIRSGTWMTARMGRRKGIPVREYILRSQDGALVPASEQLSAG